MTRKTLNKLQNQQKKLYNMFTGKQSAHENIKPNSKMIYWNDSPVKHYSSSRHSSKAKSTKSFNQSLTNLNIPSSSLTKCFNIASSTHKSLTTTLTMCNNLTKINYDPIQLPKDLQKELKRQKLISIDWLYSINLSLDLIAFDSQKLNNKSTN